MRYSFITERWIKITDEERAKLYSNSIGKEKIEELLSKYFNTSNLEVQEWYDNDEHRGSVDVILGSNNKSDDEHHIELRINKRDIENNGIENAEIINGYPLDDVKSIGCGIKDGLIIEFDASRDRDTYHKEIIKDVCSKFLPSIPTSISFKGNKCLLYINSTNGNISVKHFLEDNSFILTSDEAKMLEDNKNLIGCLSYFQFDGKFSTEGIYVDNFEKQYINLDKLSKCYIDKHFNNIEEFFSNIKNLKSIFNIDEIFTFKIEEISYALSRMEKLLKYSYFKAAGLDVQLLNVDKNKFEYKIIDGSANKNLNDSIVQKITKDENDTKDLWDKFIGLFNELTIDDFNTKNIEENNNLMTVINNDDINESVHSALKEREYIYCDYEDSFEILDNNGEVILGIAYYDSYSDVSFKINGLCYDECDIDNEGIEVMIEKVENIIKMIKEGIVYDSGKYESYI